jgi:hypothetical protein
MGEVYNRSNFLGVHEYSLHWTDLVLQPFSDSKLRTKNGGRNGPASDLSFTALVFHSIIPDKFTGFSASKAN